MKPKYILSNKGFSLLELIIVITIMSIFIAVLSPTMIHYVEMSRANKDALMMSEMSKAIIFGAADQNVYDEIVANSMEDNVSCYIDSESESTYEMVVTRTNSNGNTTQYMFDDEARTKDEIKYFAAGIMRGVTITFERSQSDGKIRIEDAVVNKFLGESAVEIEKCPYLQRYMEQWFGEALDISSKRYRNSEFTIFVRINPKGGTEIDERRDVVVYGQFNGTNLIFDGNGYDIASKT